MHYRIIVIKPKEIELDKIMYKFEEIDKNQSEKMADERCVFIKQIDEQEIPLLLTKIYEHYNTRKNEYFEYLTYRVTHTLKEYVEKYDKPFSSYNWRTYKRCVDALNEYEIIEDLPFDDLKLIQFIKEHGSYVKWDNRYIYPVVYIKGIGYGYFDNPYAIFDYYRVATEEWYKHLKTKNGKDTNNCLLVDLDVEETLGKIDEYDYYSYMIFCENNISDAKLFTVENYRFNEMRGNVVCLVEDTGDVLRQLQSQYGEDSKYEVMVLDIHS